MTFLTQQFTKEKLDTLLSLIFVRLDFHDLKKFHETKVPGKKGAGKIKDAKFSDSFIKAIYTFSLYLCIQKGPSLSFEFNRCISMRVRQHLFACGWRYFNAFDQSCCLRDEEFDFFFRKCQNPTQ